jgi:hypothetical protein
MVLYGTPKAMARHGAGRVGWRWGAAAGNGVTKGLAGGGPPQGASRGKGSDGGAGQASATGVVAFVCVRVSGGCIRDVVTSAREMEVVRGVSERFVAGVPERDRAEVTQRFAIVNAAVEAGGVPLPEAAGLLTAAVGGRGQVCWAGEWEVLDRTTASFPRRLRATWREALGSDSRVHIAMTAPPDRPIVASGSEAFRQWCRLVAWRGPGCHDEGVHCFPVTPDEREATLPGHCTSVARTPCDARAGTVSPSARVPR